MSFITLAIIGIIVLVILLFMGMNIGITMMAVGFFGVFAIRGLDPAVGV